MLTIRVDLDRALWSDDIEKIKEYLKGDIDPNPKLMKDLDLITWCSFFGKEDLVDLIKNHDNYASNGPKTSLKKEK